jgi:hypothetical protein
MEHGPVYRFCTHPLVVTVLGAALLVWLGWRFGPFAVLIGVVPVAAIVSRPLINLVGLARDRVREEVWLPEHGDWYAFRDVRVRVVEDDDGHRWVPVADVRKMVTLKVADDTLRRLYPDRSGSVGDGRALHLRSDALQEYLSRSTDDVTLRFRTWIDRTITEPARRKRLGHRD